MSQAVFNPQKRFVNFMLFAIVALLLNLLLSLKAGYADRFSICTYIASMSTLAVLIVMYKNRLEFAATLLSTFFFNIVFFIFTYYYGLRALVFVYYFPFLIAYVYMFKDQATKTHALVFFYTSVTFITAIFLVCSMNGISGMDEKYVVTMYKKNFLISFAMSSFYFYSIFTYLLQQNSKLQAQKKLAEEASQAKARFLSIMSHELRTPLNGIIGTVHLMSTTDNEAEKNRFLHVLQTSSRHLLHLVNNVLDYSKASEGKMELQVTATRPAELLQNLYSVFRVRFQEKNIAFVFDIDPALQQPVMMDEIRMVQVLTNLVSNALKYTDAGTVRVQAICKQANDKELTIQVSVTDTGKGLTPEQQAVIFDSFTNIHNKSRSIESTGLGLSISKKIVELMGGDLTLESQPNAGSRFYFQITVPVAAIAFTNDSPAEQEPNISLQGITVLVAEDDPINMLVITEFLKRRQVQILEAGNGLQAIQQMKQQAIDLVLLDLQMPEVDGYQTLQWILQHKPQLPAIAFTASLLDHEDKQRLFSLGFTEVVPKPFPPDELDEKMKMVLLKSRKNPNKAA